MIRIKTHRVFINKTLYDFLVFLLRQAKKTLQRIDQVVLTPYTPKINDIRGKALLYFLSKNLNQSRSIFIGWLFLNKWKNL